MVSLEIIIGLLDIWPNQRIITQNELSRNRRKFSACETRAIFPEASAKESKGSGIEIGALR